MSELADNWPKVSDISEDSLYSEENKLPEMVDHPKHYNSHPSGIECITVIEPMAFNIGSAIKYLWRAGLKPGADHKQDLEKAIWYIQREIERMGT